MMIQIETDDICMKCEHRLKCLMNEQKIAYQQIEGMILRVGCWVETNKGRRVEITGVGIGYDHDACCIISLMERDIAKRIEKPSEALRCRYCGISVYNISKHLEKCVVFNKGD